jgi:hypothetical protein
LAIARRIEAILVDYMIGYIARRGFFPLFRFPMTLKPILTPNEFNTRTIVSNLGLASGCKALYKLSRPNPQSDAIFAIPLALAISPIAANNNLGSFSSTIALK